MVAVIVLCVVTIYAHGYKQNRIGATIIYKEIKRTKQSAICKASWSSRDRQFRDTPAALWFGFVYKMLFGLVDLKFSDYNALRTGSMTRGHDYKLFLAILEIEHS